MEKCDKVCRVNLYLTEQLYSEFHHIDVSTVSLFTFRGNATLAVCAFDVSGSMKSSWLNENSNSNGATLLSNLIFDDLDADLQEQILYETQNKEVNVALIGFGFTRG